MKENNVDNTKTINILSLCTGYGGLELGLARALEGVFRVVAVEVEAYALANLATKAQEGKLAIEAMWPDLKTFPAQRFRGCFDFILAGYPCQPFSVAGKRKGTDDKRHLWPHIARIVQAVRPIWCFFENVPGHLTIGFPEVYRSLRDMGYSVEAGLFTAAEVGAPHKRERLFILAYSQSKYARTLRNKSRNRAAQAQLRGLPAMRNTWPSRPRQPQYEWEEPRVVANTCKFSRSKAATGTPDKARGVAIARPSRGQTQSRLGRAVDGTKSRVDRLRLLGNGVVPQQAEKAFRYLMPLFDAR